MFLWNKEVCLGYCIVFLLYDFDFNTYILEIDSKFHLKKVSTASF